MWPFRKRPETAADHLARRSAETPEGRKILCDAYVLARRHPHWTAGQCIRAAYWGAPGPAE